MEVYARVRRAVQVDGMSIRQAAREFGLSRKSIRKMLQFSLPPGYERKKPILRPKLGPWLGIIDQILVDDKTQHKKQRHTAKRIFDRLKAEHAFGGGYTIVKDYVRRGDPAAHRGDGDRLRVEADRQPVSGQGLLKLVAAHSGLDVGDLRHQVDVGDPVHPGQVQDHRPGRGLRPAAHAEPPPRGITAVNVCDAQVRIVATSSVLAGKTTATGTGSSSPRTRRSSASAQESMARSRRVSASVRTVPSGSRLTSMSRWFTRRSYNPH